MLAEMRSLGPSAAGGGEQRCPASLLIKHCVAITGLSDLIEYLARQRGRAVDFGSIKGDGMANFHILFHTTLQALTTR